MKTKTIKISDIVIDEDTQQRERIDLDMVAEYAESIQCGSKFPPVTVFFDSAQYWIADGYHRYYAHKSSDIHEILADVHDGTKDDAVMFSFGANGTHGKRLTNADKHKNVKRALLFHRTKELSDRDIAKVCKVTHPFVSKIRKEVVTITTNGNGNNLGNVSKTPTKPALNRDELENSSTKVELNSTSPLEPALNLETEKHDNEDYDPKEQEIRNELYGDVDPQKEIEKAHKEIDDLNKEIERLNKIIESNDMLSEIKKLSDLNQVLESQKNGYLVSLNDQKSYSKMWKNKFEKLEKSMKASGLVEF